jgi:hypothetical protein
VEADAQHVTVVGEVDEALARAFIHLAGQIGQQVEGVEVDLELLVAGFVALLELLDDVRLPGGGQEGGQPVVVLDELVGHHSGGDLARPADQLRHAERALPVGVLLAAERCRRAVGPGVGVRPVVGAVNDDGVVGDAEFVDRVEDLADIAVVVDHRVVVRRPKSCRSWAPMTVPSSIADTGADVTAAVRPSRSVATAQRHTC